MNEHHDIREHLLPGRRAHLAGIGGVSMCALAEVLHRQGLQVQGSDMSESGTVRHLRELGIPVNIGHSAEHLGDCDLVIRTAAIHDSNPEIAGAIARGIPVFERAEAWGAIMRHYRNAVCFSGTHGKTTATSMATHIFMAAGADPTVMIGGTLPLLGSGYRVGRGDTILMESCEYCNSFLSFFPTVAVLLNVEEDHLDFFKDLADIEQSFHRFAELVPADGWVVVNADDPGAMESAAALEKRVVTFAIDAEADFRAENLTWHDGLSSFEVTYRGDLYARISLQVPGRHNVLNALSAAASACLLGISGEAAAAGLATFTGAERRFQRKGTFRGADVYDDYAHHPSELTALLTTVKKLPYKRVICAFQPHTYTRTHALFHEFIAALQLADVVVLGEIFAARESNELGISSADLAKEIPGAVYCSTLDKVAEALSRIAGEGDLVLTVGAGDIFRAGEKLIQMQEA